MNMIFKTVAGDGSLEFVLSDETVDRYGDIIVAAGWVLTNFKKNPIALFGHSSSFPIGTWSNIRVEGSKLIAKLTLAKRGTSARIDELIGLVEQGVLRAVSVGFSPIKSEPLNPERPYGPQKYTKQELLETALVSVPANPAALQLAKSLNISSETMSLAFGEHAEVRRKDVSTTGEHADMTNANGNGPRDNPSRVKAKTMKTLSQRIADAQTVLTAKSAALAELNNAETLDHDAIDAANDDIDALERDIAVLKRSESRLGRRAADDAGVTAPSVNRQPLGFKAEKLDGLDLLVRRAVVHGCALHTGQSIEKMLDKHYPGHDEATAMVVTKTDAIVGTTGTSGFVSQMVQSTWASFLDALRGKSVYPALRDRGYGVSFDAAGTAYLPQLTGGGANGSFFAEGSPIRVGRITVSAPTFSSRKMGVIIPFTREAAKRATPQLEMVVRKAIVDDTAATLDPILLDATAGDTVRPAGLRYDSVATAAIAATAPGYGGGDHVAVKEDFKALLQPFIDANAADGITVIMNPKQALAISLMDGPDNNPAWFANLGNRVNIVESTHATANRLIAIRNADFATALGDLPSFEVSNQATIHMEDTTPLEIVASGSPDVTAAPVRSFWQTDSMGIRMVMDVSWTMARSGVVRWIDGTSY
jgi:HK97 family phage prohead protease/HK97 family phage major capsid protein